MRQRLRKSEILRDRQLIRRILNSGERLDGSVLTFIFLRQDAREGMGPKALVAFPIRRSQFNSVRRNRCRRLMREAYRRLRDHPDDGTADRTYLLVYPRRDLKSVPPFKEVYLDIQTAMQRIVKQ